MTRTRLPRNRTDTRAHVAGIYCRISDDAEGRELGVTRQIEDNRALAERLGVPVYRIYKDNDIGASTRSSKPRPDYKRMLADARAGLISVIIAYTSSRLTRRPREHEDQIDVAEQHGIVYRFVRSPEFDLNTAAGRMIARMLAAKDAAEAEEISERVARARRQRTEQGRFGGGVRPYGWGVQTGSIERPNRRTGELETVPVYDYKQVVKAEADVIRMCADWALVRPPVSLRGISRILNERGILTAQGKQWLPNGVRQMLIRPCAAGILVSNGEEVGRIRDAKGEVVEPPLTEETWRNLVALLTEPSRRTQTGDGSVRWLGSGIYLCPTCGGVLRAHAAGAHREAPVYRDDHVSRVAGPLDTYVRKLVIERLSRPDALELLTPPRPGIDVSGLKVQRDTLRERKTGLAEDYAMGLVDRPQLSAGTRLIDEKLVKIDRQLAETVNPSVVTPLIMADDIAAAWDALPMAAQRVVIRTLMEITILRAPRSQSFDPAFVRVRPARHLPS